MADEKNEGAEGVVEPSAAPPEGQEQGQEQEQQEIVETEEEQAPSIDEIASEMGWVPKDQFKGDPQAWKPAVQFIRDGKDIQRQQSRDLRDLRSTMDNIQRTSAQLLEDRIRDERNRLAAQYQTAVEDGDVERSYKIAGRLNELAQPSQATPSQVPSSSVQDFAQRNASWFQKDPLATQMAVDTCNKFAHLPHDEQLKLAEREVKRNYPELFPQQRNAPQVNQPNNRSAVKPKGPKTFADMPVEAQKIAKDMHDRGLIPSVDHYTRNYWATEGQAQ